MKKVLFIDRDGTLIVEPPDEQIDSLEKLEFLPGVITNLHKIAREMNYLMVMVSNQDGLGTESFPEKTFWPAHHKMLKTFAGEEIQFDDILIDRSLPADKLPTRKPGVAMLTKYLQGQYDLPNSFVIGDRESDVYLAKNIGCRSILLNSDRSGFADFTVNSWSEIYRILYLQNRRGSVVRKSSETDVQIEVFIDGKGFYNIRTGIGFFDHMLELFARHASFDLNVHVNGDLKIDEHHTVEDTAIALGSAIAEAAGSKAGIARYGFILPMDDSLAEVALDLSGRPHLNWKAKFSREKIGDMPTEMFKHFFSSFAVQLGCNLYIRAEGENEHHKIEAIFKAVAKVLRSALTRSEKSMEIPSTKGIL